MTASRTSNLILAGTLGFGSLVAIAGPVLAETPPAGQSMVLVLGDGDGGFGGPGDIAQPQPAPQPPKDKAPAPQPQPDPKPQAGPGDIVNPQGHGDPQPEDLPIADAGDGGPVVNPEIPPGPGDITDGGGCNATHGCEPEVPDDFTDKPKDEDDCHPLAASCDLKDRDPVDPEDTPPTPDSSDEDETEVLGERESRGVLPRTGAGLAGVALAGGTLTGLGAALRRLARRS